MAPSPRGRDKQPTRFGPLTLSKLWKFMAEVEVFQQDPTLTYAQVCEALGQQPDYQRPHEIAQALIDPEAPEPLWSLLDLGSGAETRVTEQGRLLYEKLQAVFAALEEFRLHPLVTGAKRVRVRASLSPISFLLPRMLGASLQSQMSGVPGDCSALDTDLSCVPEVDFRAEHGQRGEEPDELVLPPGCELEIQHGYAASIVESIAQKKSDIGLTDSAPAGEGVVREPLLCVRRMLIKHTRYTFGRFDRTKEFRLDWLRDATLFTFPHSVLEGLQLSKLIPPPGPEGRRVRLPSSALMLEWVARGLGVGLTYQIPQSLPRHVEEINDGDILKLPATRVFLYYREDEASEEVLLTLAAIRRFATAWRRNCPMSGGV